MYPFKKINLEWKIKLEGSVDIWKSWQKMQGSPWLSAARAETLHGDKQCNQESRKRKQPNSATCLSALSRI